MAEQIVRRRQVITEPTEADLTEDRTVVEDRDGSAGLGVALAVALAILAILALIAVSRGFFAPASSPSSGSSNTTPAPANTTPTPGSTYP